jgi:hypothetical protein
MFGEILPFLTLLGLARSMCCTADEKMAGVSNPGHLRKINSRSFQTDEVQESHGNSAFASAAESVT